MDIQTILIRYVLPVLAYGAITGIANLVLSRKSQIELWAEQHPKAAALQKFLRAVGLDPFNLLAAVSLWAKGKLPEAQQNGAKAVAAFKIASIAPPPPPPPPSDPPWNPSAMIAALLVVCFAAHTSACSVFGSNGSFWPKVEHCAPSPASLVSQVADILLAGGDYEAALKQKALIDGAAIVECAVAAFVQSIGHKVGASPDELAGEARGKAFLAEHSVGQ